MSQSAPGDHLCLVSGHPLERRAVLSSFVDGGLERDERVLYHFADPGSAAAVFDFLDRGAWRRYLDSGQLRVASAPDAYLDGGRLDPDRAVRTLLREVEATLTAGWRGLRVANEMGWTSGRMPESTRLLEFENAIRPALSGLPVTVICQYDRRQLARASVDRFLRPHTGQVGMDPIHSDNAMRIFPTFDPPGLRVEGSVDAHSAGAFADALAALEERADGNGDSHLDLAELQFIDLDGLRHLAWTASRLPAGRSLVLHRLAPHHRELITLLRWDEIPSLRFQNDRS